MGRFVFFQQTTEKRQKKLVFLVPADLMVCGCGGPAQGCRRGAATATLSRNSEVQDPDPDPTLGNGGPAGSAPAAAACSVSPGWNVLCAGSQKNGRVSSSLRSLDHEDDGDEDDDTHNMGLLHGYGEPTLLFPPSTLNSCFMEDLQETPGLYSFQQLFLPRSS